jgi:hypothetical protein
MQRVYKKGMRKGRDTLACILTGVGVRLTSERHRQGPHHTIKCLFCLLLLPDRSLGMGSLQLKANQ